MKTCLTVITILFLIAHGYACVNTTGSGTKLDGAWTSASSPRGVMGLRYALSRNLQKDGTAMEAALRGATNYNDRSDYSVALMYLGRPNEAVELLQKLEKAEPGHYFVAANLGTAYELTGNNVDAMHWISEGMHRNPQSHEGTEWLHLKILEAKIAQQKDSDYFKKHSVLDLRPENLSARSLITERELSPDKVANAIQYQLQERLQFVKPPDPAVASLLFDYAAIEAATRTLEPAKTILQMAVEYGYPADQVQPLMKLYDRRIIQRKIKQYTFYTFLGFGAIGLLFLLHKKGIFVLSSRDLKRA